jgi:alkylation response protein AidB-like acyl-CoA dehydrogenase
MRLLSEERIRNWTNQRVRAGVRSGRPPGPESSVGKVHQGDLNQRVQRLATDLLGPAGAAWPSSDPAVDLMHESAVSSDRSGRDASDRYSGSMPYEVKGMLRSRANTIEGGTTEINKNIIAERVLGLPREPDPWAYSSWKEIPRS